MQLRKKAVGGGGGGLGMSLPINTRDFHMLISTDKLLQYGTQACIYLQIARSD